MVRICEVPVHVIADVHLIGHPALGEEQIDQLAGIHPGVLVGVRNDCRHSCHCKNLSYRVPAQPCCCSKLAPVDICLDEKAANDASNHSKEKEWDQLKEDPGFIVLDVKENAVLVAKRVD